MFGACSDVCFLLSGAMLDAVFTYGGSTIGVCTIAALWSLHVAGICATLQCSLAHTRYAQSGCFLHCFGLGEPHATESDVPKSSQLYSEAYSFQGLAESHPIPLPSLHGGEGLLFPGLVPSNDTVNFESVVGIKPGDSGVVIGYQVDEFTHNWSAEPFVAHSHIYPGFTGKVSSLTHFLLEPGCEDYSFLDQAVAEFEQGLDFILTDFIETPELDTSLDEPDAVTSSVLFLIMLNCSLLPALGLIKLWCQARALLAPVPLATKISASKLILYFSSHPAAFGSGPLHHQITSPWLLVTGRLIRVY